MPAGRRTSLRAQQSMWEMPRGGHHYVRIHDSARRRDILFLVPTQHLVQQNMLFSARVHFEQPEPVRCRVSLESSSCRETWPVFM